MNTYFNKQPKPELKNSFLHDDVLQYYIKKFIPQNVLDEIWTDLCRFGDKCVDEYIPHAEDAERNKPIFEKYDAWGNEINKIHTTYGWKFFHEETCREKLISIGYNFHHRKYARLYQFIKTYLFAPSCGLYGCPNSMTDGAAYLINLISESYPEYLSHSMKEAFNSILTTNPKYFWTSGQWMTELLGGSDVRGSTQTLATHIEGNKYCLHGLKWFTSAIDANITFTLAKIKHKDNTIDNAPTLFFLKLRNQDGTLNNINVIRFKDKMGTKQLPTAELELQGTVAEIASPPKKGITLIMNLANITRLHNITFSVGYMRRMIALLEDYSKKRKVFGKELSQQPLHIIEVSKMKFTFEGNFLFLLQVVKMYSKAELDKNYKNKDLLRLILPIAKLFAARCSEEVCLEGVQGFGGVGYMENSFIPQILRDTIVTSIWEGSINLLSFDFMKVLQSNVKVFENFVAKILKRIKLIKNQEISKEITKLFENIIKSLPVYLKDEKNYRAFAFLLSSMFIISLIAKHQTSNYNIALLRFWLAKTNQYFENLKLANELDLSEIQKYTFSSTAKPKF